MSRASEPTGTGAGNTFSIPSMLTTSVRAVLEHFGTDIVSLTAEGSTETTNRSVLDGLREYNVVREHRDRQRIVIDYERLHGRDGADNPLTPEVQERIFSELDALLGQERFSGKPDLAVSEVTVRITEPRLQEVTPAQTPEFDLRFVADQAEEHMRGVTKRLNAERRLYEEQGFNIRNLNLRSVFETEALFHEQSDAKYMSWGGPRDIRPRSPERLAVRINEHILPERYGTLKPYYVADDHVLELPEDAATEIESTLLDRNIGEGGDGA